MRIFGRCRHERGTPLLLRDESSTNLGNGSNKTVVFYDPDVMMDLSSSLCEGYITLLTGGCAREQARGGGKSPTSVMDDKALTLAFAAVRDGNVIDACFGIHMPSAAKDTTSFAATLVREAKTSLDDASDDNERVERLAVQAYQMGFQTIVDMNEQLDMLNIFTRCFRTKKIRKQAVNSLEHEFLQLDQAVAATL